MAGLEEADAGKREAGEEINAPASHLYPCYLVLFDFILMFTVSSFILIFKATQVNSVLAHCFKFNLTSVTDNTLVSFQPNY